MAENKIYLVTNRSAGEVVYAIPDMGIKMRSFQPGETKKITGEELRNLGYLPGGNVLLRDYLQIQDSQVRDELIGSVEPEYNMSTADVKNLILSGSYDEWLDCLDFAPDGVIDIVKSLSIDLPLTDTRKMAAFKEKKGFDLQRAILAKQEEAAELAAAGNAENDKPAQRRVQKDTSTETTGTTRRTSGSKYNVVNKAN